MHNLCPLSLSLSHRRLYFLPLSNWRTRGEEERENDGRWLGSHRRKKNEKRKKEEEEEEMHTLWLLIPKTLAAAAVSNAVSSPRPPPLYIYSVDWISVGSSTNDNLLLLPLLLLFFLDCTDRQTDRQAERGRFSPVLLFLLVFIPGSS